MPPIALIRDNEMWQTGFAAFTVFLAFLYAFRTVTGMPVESMTGGTKTGSAAAARFSAREAARLAPSPAGAVARGRRPVRGTCGSCAPRSRRPSRSRSRPKARRSLGRGHGLGPRRRPVGDGVAVDLAHGREPEGADGDQARRGRCRGFVDASAWATCTGLHRAGGLLPGGVRRWWSGGRASAACGQGHVSMTHRMGAQRLRLSGVSGKRSPVAPPVRPSKSSHCRRGAVGP